MTSAPSSPTHPSRAHTTVSPFPLYTHHLSPVLLFTTRHVISLGLCAESERELLHCTLCVGCRLRNHHHHHLVVVVERRMTHAAAAIKPCSYLFSSIAPTHATHRPHLLVHSYACTLADGPGRVEQDSPVAVALQAMQPCGRPSLGTTLSLSPPRQTLTATTMPPPPITTSAQVPQFQAKRLIPLYRYYSPVGGR